MKVLTMAGDNSKLPASEIERPLLETLGWQSHFAQQVSRDDLENFPPARIVEVNRNSFRIVGAAIDEKIATQPEATVGDWVLFDRDAPQSCRILERKSLLKRRAPGSDRQIQLIAANIDTAFIVTSCNPEFNVARLERYIALAFEAKITPVIVLTKADLAVDSQVFVDEARATCENVSVVLLDARGDEPNEKLAKWCRAGETVAFLGSSGVGKSTLTNALAGTQSIETKAIREIDSRGRHTTTRRQLHCVPSGCMVLDTPGMRELQLTDAASGISDVFADLHALSVQCRFGDCQHDVEPGCAVRAALENGEIDEARLGRWRKLLAEEAFNSANLAERRSKDKAFGKMVRRVKKQKHKRDWSQD